MQSAVFKHSALGTLFWHTREDMPHWTTSKGEMAPQQFNTCKEVLMIRGVEAKFLYGKFATRPNDFESFVKSLNDYCKSNLTIEIYHGAEANGGFNRNDYFLVVKLDSVWTKANWQLGLLAAILDMGWSCQFSDIKQLEFIPLRTTGSVYYSCYSWRYLLSKIWATPKRYESFWFVLRNFDRIKSYGKATGKSLAGWLSLTQKSQNYYRHLLAVGGESIYPSYWNWALIEKEFPEVKTVLTTARLSKKKALEIMGDR